MEARQAVPLEEDQEGVQRGLKAEVVRAVIMEEPQEEPLEGALALVQIIQDKMEATQA